MNYQKLAQWIVDIYDNYDKDHNTIHLNGKDLTFDMSFFTYSEEFGTNGDFNKKLLHCATACCAIGYLMIKIDKNLCDYSTSRSLLETYLDCSYEEADLLYQRCFNGNYPDDVEELVKRVFCYLANDQNFLMTSGTPLQILRNTAKG